MLQLRRRRSGSVWRKTDGQQGIWLMDGANAPSFNGLTTPGPGWRIAAAGDLNADGKTDLVWIDDVSGLSMGLMNGAVIDGGYQPVVEDPSWVPIIAADFDDDGDVDLLMRKGDGKHQVWIMQGALVVSKTDVLAAATGWEAAP